MQIYYLENINKVTELIYKDKLVLSYHNHTKNQTKRLDFVRSGDNIGYADLNQDGMPEIVHGAAIVGTNKFE